MEVVINTPGAVAAAAAVGWVPYYIGEWTPQRHNNGQSSNYRYALCIKHITNYRNYWTVMRGAHIQLVHRIWPSLLVATQTQLFACVVAVIRNNNERINKSHTMPLFLPSNWSIPLHMQINPTAIWCIWCNVWLWNDENRLHCTTSITQWYGSWHAKWHAKPMSAQWYIQIDLLHC